jgi:SAM-dependent methyltransferase
MAQNETLEEVRKAARARLYPSLSNPNWLVLRERRKLFQRWLANVPGTSLRVLDVGGRIQPYRVLLEGRCTHYVAIDLQRTPLINVIGTAEQLPFGDGVFDLVVCTQVLEYIENPRAVIAEMRRSLKPGGFLLLSVPSVFPRDSEVEYWRFLPRALRSLLSDFSAVDVAPEGNSLAGFLRTVNVCTVTFARPEVLAELLSFTLIPLLNVLAACVQRFGSGVDDRFTANFSALAQK